jgi:hypothetical protein
MNLYKLTLTCFAVAPDERAAEDLAVANHPALTIEKVERPETLCEIPEAWRTCQPFGGAPSVNVEQHLIRQIAGTREYTEFCVQPFKILNGNAEPASANDPLAEFGVYARYRNGLAIHLADFPFQLQAELFKCRIERARQMQSLSRQAEDAHLEAQFEEQVCGLLVD